MTVQGLALNFPIAAAEFPARVLIVDNEPLICWALTAGLRLAGFDAIAVATAREAVVLASSEPRPAAIMIDAGLPDCDQLVLSNALHYACPGVPLVSLSTGQESTPPAGCHSAVIRKPFDLTDVVRTINRIGKPL